MINEKREVQIKDIQNIHSQLNYTNQLLHQMTLINSDEKHKKSEQSLVKPFKFSEKEL